MRVLLYAKMLKETETKETIVLFCNIFIIESISIEGGPGHLGPPWLRLCKGVQYTLHCFQSEISLVWKYGVEYGRKF